MRTDIELHASRWFNTHQPLTLEGLLASGRAVVVLTFQMLCPGCVSHAIPQARRLRELFREEDLAVVGLHTVFEHHEAMTPMALQAFLHEYRITFPVGVDEPATDGPIPRTMGELALPGTPNLLVFDRRGRLRLNHFGHIEDLALGAIVGGLLAEAGVPVIGEEATGQ